MFLKSILTASVLIALPLTANAATSSKPYEFEEKINHVISADAEFATDRYFVQLRDLPAALINTEVSNKKSKFNMSAAPTKARTMSLQQKQQSFTNELTSTIGRMPTIHHRYQVAFNGMSVDLTEKEAEKLLALPQVLKVIRQVEYKLNTDVSPKHIGADVVWEGANGTSLPAKGEGIIMGIIDSGINVDHPSFAAQGDDGYVHTNPNAGYLGDCETDATLCNDKLIGVFSYDSITSGYNGIRPENGVDYNGHGSHVSSTAAGNILQNLPYSSVGSGPVSDGVPVEGTNIAQMSGIAPHANIISFQVCQPVSGCAEDAMLQAVEDAIIHGVDVINMSIGPNGEGQHPWSNALDMAFLAAHEAGTFVALSAGNSGSGASTVGHLAPWTAIVANASHGRYFEKTVTAPDSVNPLPELVGKGNMAGTLSGEVVYAGDIDSSRTNCNFYNFLDFPEIEGKVVLCDRGNLALMQMAQNVNDHGGVGIIIRNTDGSSTELHSIPFPIPGAMLDQTDGITFKDWMDTEESPTVRLSAGVTSVDEEAANIINVSSSRGPNSRFQDLVVPHIAAPGTDVYAAYTDEQPFHSVPAPSDYAFLTGTSMASPHIAGSAALVKQVNPDWTPSEILSAMMLTANSQMKKEDGTTAADLWDMGSGMVRVDRAVNAGLILNVTKDEFLAANPQNSGDVTSLNMPLLTNAQCAGTCTWTRTFEATKDADWTFGLASNNYSFSSFTATPSVIEAKAGESYEVTFTANIAQNSTDDWITSQMAITSGADTLLMPINVKPLVAIVPEEINKDYYYLQGKFSLDGFKFRRPEGVFFTNTPLIKAQSHEVSFTSADSDVRSPFDDLTDGVSYFTVDIEGDGVPLDIYISAATNLDTDLFVGLDSNGDGIPQEMERICVSSTPANKEHCQLPGTLSGSYWIMAWNYDNGEAGNTSAIIDIVKGSEDNTIAMNVAKGSGRNAFDELEMTATWDANLDTEANYYSKINTFMRNETTGEFINYKDTTFVLKQLGEPASVSIANSAVSVGETNELMFEFAPNQLSQDVTYNIELTLADGFMLTDDSLGEFTAKTGHIEHTVTVAGNTQSATTLSVPYMLTEAVTGEFTHTVTIASDYTDWQTEQSFTQVNDNTAPQVSIEASTDSANAGDTVTLSAVADSDEELSYKWRQTSGVSVMTEEAEGSSLTLTMPSIPRDTELGFEVVVSDGELFSTVSKTITLNKDSELIDNDEQDEEESGSLYYLLLLALPAILIRRK